MEMKPNEKPQYDDPDIQWIAPDGTVYRFSDPPRPFMFGIGRIGIDFTSEGK